MSIHVYHYSKGSHLTKPLYSQSTNYQYVLQPDSLAYQADTVSTLIVSCIVNDTVVQPMRSIQQNAAITFYAF